MIIFNIKYVSETEFICARPTGGTDTKWGEEKEKGIGFADTNSAEQDCVDQEWQGETVEENIDGRTNDPGCLCTESSSSIEGNCGVSIIERRETA